MNFNSRSSFTLIELLVVIAIISVISIVVVLTINPAELLRQSRDSNRLSDLNTINTALGLFNADQPTASMGSTTQVYISVPDSSATCANLGLPSLPTGWVYGCVTSSSLRKADGTGWIPINFSSIAFGTPLASLPIDPVNATSSKQYYSYVAGSWKLGGTLEATKYSANAANDGGSDPSALEVGSNLALAPFSTGLVDWWTFDDNNNSTTSDSSGYGNTIWWQGTSTTRYGVGKVGTYAAYFDGNTFGSSTAKTGYTSGAFGRGDFTVTLWENGNQNTAAYPAFLTTAMCGCSNPNWTVGKNDSGTWNIGDIGEGQKSTSPSYTLGTSWHFFAFLRSGSSMQTYVDGALYGSNTDTNPPWNLTDNNGGVIIFGTNSNTLTRLKNTYMDDIRIYNRALTSAQILAMYNATR